MSVRCLGCAKLIRSGSRCAACSTLAGRGRGANGWELQRRNARLLTRDMGICRSCGGRATQVDHIVPLSRGGSDEARNLQSLCGRCHAAKTRSEAAR